MAEGLAGRSLTDLTLGRSNRNALYKLLHDARRKLKSHLVAHGFDAKILDLFAAGR